MRESNDFTRTSRKAWKTINKLTKYYTAPQQQCRITADQVVHQLLRNGEGNNSHVLQRENIPNKMQQNP